MGQSKPALYIGIALMGVCFIVFDRLYLESNQTIHQFACKGSVSYDKFGGKFCAKDDFVFISLNR